MKKISIMLLAALAVLFAFTACPGENEVTPASEEQVDTIAQYLSAFGYDRVLLDLNTLMGGTGSVTGLKLAATNGITVTDDAITIQLEATDYDFDGHIKDSDPDFPRTVSGDVTLVLSGEKKSETSFEATDYAFTSADGVTFEMDAKIASDELKAVDDITVVLDGVKGKFVVDAEGETLQNKSLAITLANGKATAIHDPKNAGEFAFPTTGPMKVGEATVDLSALKTAVFELKDAAAEAGN